MLRAAILFLLLVGSSLACAEVALLTSIKPLQLIAAAVQNGIGEPGVLLPPGASPHHYTLRPSDVRRLQGARLFYWIGPDLEGFLARPLAARTQPSVAVEDLPGLQLLYYSATPVTDDNENHDHAHRPGALDAHLWLLPANALRIAERMAADLAAADPANAARYQANLEAFSSRLKLLDVQLKSRLTGIRDKPYFVFHETYGYFEQAYGLKHAGVFNVVGDVPPGARHVAELRLQLQQAGPCCVFSEPPMQPRLARTLTEGLPARLAELDAMGSTLPVSPQGYEQLLKNLANGLVACLTES